MKAFLSHSSKDEEFVKAVALELGRQYCVYDEWSFETGDQFKMAIEKGLDESSVFVLFASRDALASVWVNFEQDEAWFRKLRDTLSVSLVYLIESGLTAVDLPEWLRRAKISSQNVPKAAARDIRLHLDEVLLQRQRSYFVGRTKDIAALEQALTPIDGTQSPRAMFISGLPGIGRRSLVRQVMPGILNLRKQIEIRIGEGDTSNDICIRVADIVEPYSTQEGFARIVKQILELSDSDAVLRTFENLKRMVAQNELPIFVDEGGLLDSEGNVLEAIRAVIRRLAPNDERYIFFISARRPLPIPSLPLPVLQLDPLPLEDCRRLIALLAARDGIAVSPTDVAEIARYVAGYPPAAYFAIRQAKQYGLKLLLSDKSRLVEFRTSIFLKHFAELSLSVDEQNLLRLLGFYSPMPLRVIAEVMHYQLEALGDILIRLIDLALITTTDEGFYRIADPVADAALKAFGFPPIGVHAAVAINLDEFLQAPDLNAPRLDLSRALFRAARLAKRAELEHRAIYLANDLIRLTEELYHQREYSQSIQTGLTALEQRPDSVTARSFVVRALIQEERFDEAEKQIRELQKHSPLRDVCYLRGFFERKRGEVPAAIEEYLKSQRLGRKGAAISRELALCYFLQGDMDLASKHIAEAMRRHGDNRYVVDLYAQIATRQRDEPAAREALARLELIDKKLYYFHRLSRIELAFGHLYEARKAARTAVESETSPPFEALAQLAYCEIDSGNQGEAEKILALLDQRFGHIRHDVRVGLRCKLEMARGRFRDALSQSERIKAKHSVFYKKIRAEALAGELDGSGLSDAVRAAYAGELKELDKELSEITAEQFIPAELGGADISD